MRLKVRPFRGVIERGIGEPAIEARGEFRHEVYVLTIDAMSFELPIAAAGVDGHGEFAEIDECEMPAPHGFRLLIFAEPDEDNSRLGLDPECVIELVKESDQAKRFLRQAGIDPESVNLLSPPDSSITLYFDRIGRFDYGSTIVSVRPQSGGTSH